MRSPVPRFLLVACGLAGPPGCSSARASEPLPERPALPSWSMAGDDGAPAVWSNPANLGLDPDGTWSVLYSQALDPETPAQVAAVTNAGPLATGLVYRGAAGVPSWWTLSTGLGLRLDRDLAFGVHLGWQIPEGPLNNFVTWDLGLAWRPANWLGLAAVAQNIGSPAPEMGVEERYGPGLVLRPFEDRLQVGADYLFTGTTGSMPDGLLGATARVEPLRGVTLRMYADQEATFGGGVEVAFGRAGAGAHARVPGEGDPAVLTGYALSSVPERKVVAVGGRVVRFDLEGDFPYQPAGGFFVERRESWVHLVERFRKAAADPTVRGLIVTVRDPPDSFARIEEMRAAIAAARAAGKRVVVYLDASASNGAYYLATAADRVFAHPAGDLDLVGLSAELMFFRGTLDLVGVEPQFARRSEYKSGPEPLTNTEGSPAAREELDALLDDLTRRFVEGIAAGRGLDVSEVRRLVDGGPWTTAEAVDRGLVDGVLYADQLDEGLEREFFPHYRVDDEYALHDGISGWPGRREIAVVYVEGPIHSGESRGPGFFGGARTAGAETIGRQLRQAQREESVKAVVLRVDSPGGSSVASDEIWRAVEKVEEEGKPVVVSMGGVAASGGYYVASGATAIYAEPTTITGSIGVYGGKVSLGGLYEKLGIRAEVHTRGRNSAMWSASRPMDETEFAALDRLVGATYDQFKERVAAGRKLEPAEVERVARGRVWSGEAAQGLGLVDALGGFQDAVARARTEAGIPEGARVELVTYGDREGPDGELSREAVGVVRQLVLPRARPPRIEVPPEVAALALWAEQRDERVWAVMPWTIEVR